MVRPVVLALFAFVFTAAESQAQVVSGMVRGTVVSSAGAPVPSATVAVVGTPLSTLTDASGAFTFGRVPVGSRVIAAQAIGVGNARQSIVVVADSTVNVTLTLATTTAPLPAQRIVAGTEYFEPVSSLGTRADIPLQKVAQSVQVVPRILFDEQKGYRLTDAVRNTAGVSNGFWNFIYFRGIQTDPTQFLTNGQRGQTTNEDFSPALANVERVEFIRGPAGALYGNGALGGTLNLVTKGPTRARIRDLLISGGSFGTLRAQLDLGGRLDSAARFTYRFVTGVEQAGNNTDDYQQRNVMIAPSLRWEVTPKTTATGIVTFYNDQRPYAYDHGVPLFAGDPLRAPRSLRLSNDDADYSGRTLQGQFSLQHRWSERWSVTHWLNVSQLDSDHRYYSLDGGPSPSGDVTRILNEFKTDIPTISNNLVVNGRVTTGRLDHTLTIGVDQWFNNFIGPDGFSYSVVESPTFNIFSPNFGPATFGDPRNYYYSAYEEYKTRTFAGYVQDQIALGSDKLQALVGVRWERYDFDYIFRAEAGDPDSPDGNSATTVLPRFGLVFTPIPSTSLYASHTEGFVPVRFAQLSRGGPFPPVRGRQQEVGVKREWRDGRLSTTLAAYQIEQENVLVPVGTTNQLRPTGLIESRGVELTAMGALTPTINAVVNYAWNATETTRSSVSTDIGRRFPNAPEHSANAWITHTRPAGALRGLKLGVGGTAVSARTTALSDGAPVLPSYTTVDALVSMPVGRSSIDLNASNLFDKRYLAGSLGSTNGFYGPGRSVLLSVRYDW